ncbi:MAG: histidine phosphatase family protein [Bacteroidota bacterium]|nr:histidine phosphatase family protein [Bacteroidota bacterium]
MIQREKKIFILRHGETEQNRMGIVQGSGVDSSLNIMGEKQSQLFFEKYKSERFDFIICSNLMRSYQTIKRFELLGIPIRKDERLNEICWGEHEGKTGEVELMMKYNRIIQSWCAGNFQDKPAGGESAEELGQRLDHFLRDIQNLEFNQILICTHGRTLRALITKIKNIPLSAMEDIKHQNTGLYVAALKSDNWTVNVENDTTHLTHELNASDIRG